MMKGKKMRYKEGGKPWENGGSEIGGDLVKGKERERRARIGEGRGERKLCF